MENIDRIVSEDYVPTDDDIVRARQATVGMSHTYFTTNEGKYEWELIDVGGQGPEREKWSAVLDDQIDAMIYFSALDDYDTYSGETNDEDKTKMEVSKALLEALLSDGLTNITCHILFFNKNDLFREQLENEEQFNTFSEKLGYEGDNNYEEAIEYVQNWFIKDIPDELITNLKIHVTCAIDPALMEAIFIDIKHSIFHSRLSRGGLSI
eukprot:TRINITY_DN967_c0_g1_i2.p1 TRINITY_DN967_c0_g1~~TRINITY_DN967_c0_g1_i2.p1  ORF type:complete len:209 (-),score=53.50 TRINITY_DN967_c0_g1_i2:42-668(-)